MSRNRFLIPGRGKVAAGLIFLAAAGWAGVGFAHPPEPPFGPGHGPGHRMEAMTEHPEQLARRVDRMLDGLALSEAQRGQVRQIVLAAAKDLQSQQADGHEFHARQLKLLLAPEIDAKAIETLRAQSMARQEARSRRVTQAMIDVSQQLSPAQRAKLAERFQHAHEHGPDHGPRGPGAR